MKNTMAQRVYKKATVYSCFNLRDHVPIEDIKAYVGFKKTYNI
jgi:hypothetical protein